jgi:phosphoserine aminotransferase
MLIQKTWITYIIQFGTAEKNQSVQIQISVYDGLELSDVETICEIIKSFQMKSE